MKLNYHILLIEPTGQNLLTQYQISDTNIKTPGNRPDVEGELQTTINNKLLVDLRRSQNLAWINCYSATNLASGSSIKRPASAVLLCLGRCTNCYLCDELRGSVLVRVNSGCLEVDRPPLYQD